MSHYYTRYCNEHGEYDADVADDGYCPTCTQMGKNPFQLREKQLSDALAANALLIAENRRLRQALQSAEYAMRQHKWGFAHENTIERIAYSEALDVITNRKSPKTGANNEQG